MKAKKETKKPAKKSKAELWKIRQAYLDSLPESELNLNWKEDSEKLMQTIVPKVKPKSKKRNKDKK